MYAKGEVTITTQSTISGNVPTQIGDRKKEGSGWTQGKIVEASPVIKNNLRMANTFQVLNNEKNNVSRQANIAKKMDISKTIPQGDG